VATEAGLRLLDIVEEKEAGRGGERVGVG